MGVPPVRIDLMTSLSSVNWDEIEAGRCEGAYGDVQTWYVGREEFIRNKRATGRRKDLADLEALGED